MTDWDSRFMEMAALVASFSKDPSTKCGAVIVRPDKTIASMGFNGFPRGCDDDPEIYADRELKYSRVVHAEVNAVLHCRDPFPLDGYTMYTYPGNMSPTCDRCATVVIQSGIRHIVHQFVDGSTFAERWKVPCENALRMYEEAGVYIQRFGLDKAPQDLSLTDLVFGQHLK
jgi:dCMP deaminase